MSRNLNHNPQIRDVCPHRRRSRLVVPVRRAVRPACDVTGASRAVGLRRSLIEAVSRALWTLLLAVHLPALSGVLASLSEDGWAASRWAALIALLAGCGVFVLKACGRSWPLGRGTPRDIVFWIVVALLHRETLPPLERMPLDQAATLGLVTVAAGVGSLAGSGRGRRALRSLGRRIREELTADRSRELMLTFGGRCVGPSSPAAGPMLLYRLAAPRGPPLGR